MITEENYLGETETIIHNRNRYNLVRMSLVLAYGIYVTVDQLMKSHRNQSIISTLKFNKDSFDWNINETYQSLIFAIVLAICYIINLEIW